MEIKEEDRFVAECNTCNFNDDPCHYLCQLCRNGENWEPKSTLEQTLTKQIEKHKKEIIRLEILLKEVVSRR